MAAAEDNPAGYYFGRPTNSDERKAPAPPAKKAVDEKVNPPVQCIPGYYAGRVGHGKPAADDNSSADDARRDGKPRFLAKWLLCCSGRGNAR